MHHIIWIDIEAGGLNGPTESGELGASYYPILEISVVITDHLLGRVGQPFCMTIFQEEQELEKLDDYVRNMHTENGLLKDVREAGLTLAEAEEIILNHLAENGVEKYDRKARTGGIMAGNSIKYDRDFIMCQMPKLDQYLHYRQLDISALALAYRSWNPDIANEVNKEYGHRAIDDIRESINEASVYMLHIQNQPPADLFHVVAGHYEQLEGLQGFESIDYTNAHHKLDDAIADCMEHSNHPFSYINYKGVTLHVSKTDQIDFDQPCRSIQISNGEVKEVVDRV